MPKPKSQTKTTATKTTKSSAHNGAKTKKATETPVNTVVSTAITTDKAVKQKTHSKSPSAAVQAWFGIKPRRRKAERYTSFRLHRKIKTPRPQLKGTVELFLSTWNMIVKHRRLFVALTALYAVLTLVLVRGFNAAVDVAQTKDALKEVIQGDWAGVTITTSLFGALLGTAGAVGVAEGTAYQSLLLVIIILATIWTLRQLTAGKPVTMRESLYRGLYPLAVFVSVLFMIGLQLLPLAIGSWLYSALIGGGIVVTLLEKSVTALIFGLLAILSLYMVSSSLFALFISTLPGMTPMRALRSARQLVLHRRLQVIARILVFLIGIPILSLLIMVPFIVWLPMIAEWVFFVLSTFGTIFTVVFMYLLYRELLNE